MPAVSQAQAEFFRYKEHHGGVPGMTHEQMHDFAATPNAGLPRHTKNGRPQHYAFGGQVPRFSQGIVEGTVTAVDGVRRTQRLHHYDAGGVTSPWDSLAERQAFYQKFGPLAQKWSQQTGIPASTFLAIAASESNFGRAGGNMLFGIVGRNGTAGGINLGTETGPQYFRAYNNPDEAFEDFVKLVSTSPNYARAWANRTNDSAFVAGLQAGGYAGNATENDRRWSNTIGRITNLVEKEAPSVAAGSAPATTTASAPSAKAATSYTWQRPVTGAIAEDNPFGAAWSGYANGFHTGVDFLAPGGSSVVSATPGTITWLGPRDRSGSRTLVNGPLGGTGNTVEITDSEGNVHTYAHLANFNDALREGMSVGAGTDLGKVGATGNAQGPHLHYEVKPAAGGERGVPQADPVKFLQGRGIDINKTDEQAGTGTAQPAAPQVAAPAQPTGTPGTPPTPTRPAQTKAEKALDDAIASLPDLQKAYEDALAKGDPFAIQTAAKRIGDTNTLISALFNVDARYAGQASRPTNLVTAASAQDTARIAAFNANAAVVNSVQKSIQDGWDNVRQMLQIISGNQQNIFKDYLDIANEQEARIQKAFEIGLAEKNLSVTAAVAYVDAVAKQQLAEATRAAEVLNRAKFVSDAQFKLAERALPPGTDYQPGLAPSSPLNNALRDAGLGEEVLRAVQVPRSSLDPLANLQAAETSPGIQPHAAFPLGMVKTAAEEAQAFAQKPYVPSDLPANVAGNIPQSLTTSSFGALPPQLTAGQFGTATGGTGAFWDMVNAQLAQGGTPAAAAAVPNVPTSQQKPTAVASPPAPAPVAQPPPATAGTGNPNMPQAVNISANLSSEPGEESPDDYVQVGNTWVRRSMLARVA